MKNTKIDELKIKIDSIKKRLDTEEKQKEDSLLYSIAFSLFAFSLTLFFTNYMIEKSFSQILTGEITEIMQQYNLPILENLQAYFLIGAWILLIFSLIFLLIILIKKHPFQRLSLWITKLFKKFNK